MSVKINSINIRRLYSNEELSLANQNRRLLYEINDIQTYEKIKQLRDKGICIHYKSLELNNKKIQFTLEEMRNSFISSSFYDSKNTYRDRKKVAVINKFIKRNSKNIDNKLIDEFSRENETIINMRSEIKENVKKLHDLLMVNKKTRCLKDLYQTDQVAIANSDLTESLDIEDYTYSDKIIIIVSDQEYMMKNIIEDGFVYNNNKYTLFSASAGQLRKKKLMFIEENALRIAMPKLTNGLFIDDINKSNEGGININKWSAYLALSTSATKEWIEVDLDRICIVDDFETILQDRNVDHINDNYEISRVKRDVVIPHTDGFGMIDPKFCKDTRMIRAPWIKGLVSPMNFRKFSEEYGGKTAITDIWGMEYNLDSLDMILTKSQFKMWKYYQDWNDYKEKFRKNGCKFRFMISEKDKNLKLKAMLNYQMWNTLEIKNKREFAEDMIKLDKEKIVNAHHDLDAMLDMFNVNEEYDRNNALQKALYLYPSMLKNDGFKKMLKDNITARKKELRQGRIKINGVYTFIIPDVFAWCEYLLLDNKDPKGLLKDGEVSCRLVNGDKDICVNRSPHLYKEWCVRKNMKNPEHRRWFISKGVYTSAHDMISKQLFFDVDGDIALVIDNDEVTKVAKHTMKDIVPLDFRLEKAKPEKITKSNIYDSYKLAFKANIGYYSNLITKVMNGNMRNDELVAKICWINNQVIDYAKTKWQLSPTEELEKQLKELDKRRLPYFFIWAKDKKRNSVASPNENSLVDQMALSIDEMESNIKFNLRKIDKFDINCLLSVDIENIEDNKDLVKLFKKLAMSKYQTMIRMKVDGDTDYRHNYVNKEIKREMKNYCFKNGISIDTAADVCINHVFTKNSERDVLFTIFGDIIVKRLEDRFSDLLNGTMIRCKKCGKLVEKKNNKTIYCNRCSKEVLQQQKNKWKREKWCKNDNTEEK